jgi:hypothetical protein
LQQKHRLEYSAFSGDFLFGLDIDCRHLDIFISKYKICQPENIIGFDFFGCDIQYDRPASPWLRRRLYRFEILANIQSGGCVYYDWNNHNFIEFLRSFILVIPDLIRDPVENHISHNLWIPAFTGMTKNIILNQIYVFKSPQRNDSRSHQSSG